MPGAITLKGAAELIATLERLGGDMNEIAAAALKQEAENIMADSKDNYVPVESGVLRSSAYVGDPQITQASIEVEMGYGGAASDYALVQT